VIRRALLAAGAIVLPLAAFDLLTRRASRGLLDAPRTTPDEAALGAALDALGGEVVRIRSRDGLRLTARWLSAEPGDAGWRRDPHEAILLLHGWSGSSVPDLVEYGPYLRRTAGVLGLDFRGHGGSDASPTTFGLRELEDVAGALAWLGERGIQRVALFGTSLGGITAIASVAILGDGSMPGADADPAVPAHVAPPRRPRILAVIADSVPPELVVAVRSRVPGWLGRGPGSTLLARRLFDAVTRTLGADPREIEPIRVIGLLDGVSVMLIRGGADATVPLADARRLAAAAPPGTDHFEVARATHAGAHRHDPAAYEARTTSHLQAAFLHGRGADL
jgi:pimeloyl-ACP methyl ester carboxylesterase